MTVFDLKYELVGSLGDEHLKVLISWPRESRDNSVEARMIALDTAEGKLKEA